MRSLITLSAALTFAAMSLGCAVDATDVACADAECGADEQALYAGDRDEGPVEEAALDGALGEEIASETHSSNAVAVEDDRGGPDPTPWKLEGEEVQGPDPTPWHEGDVEAGRDPSPWHTYDDDEDDYVGAADDMGPDPTPWRRSDFGSEDHPWVVDGARDDDEPDPQPWQASHAGNGTGNADD